MRTSEEINEVAKALCLAQQAMKPAHKDSVNPHFKSRFSDFASIWDAIRVPVTSNGLTILQDVTTVEKSISMTTRIIHTSGQWIEFGPLIIPLSKYDAHGVGSATTYAKRYALSAALGVVSLEDDDDGNEAIVKSKKEESVDENVVTAEQIGAINELIGDDGKLLNHALNLLESKGVLGINTLKASWFTSFYAAIDKKKKEFAS